MQMIDDIVKELAESTAEYSSEISELKRFLQKIEREAGLLRIDIPKDRWLAIGAHVLAFLRRMANQERLPVIEAELFAEIHPDMVALSRRVLEKEQEDGHVDETEAFLLAVHFEAIRVMQTDPS